MFGTPAYPAPGPSPAQNQSEPLPHVLRGDGPVAQALNGARSLAGSDSELAELCAICESVFVRLQAVETWADLPALAPFHTLYEKLTEFLRRSELWPPDMGGAVFRHLVLKAHGLNPCPPPGPEVLARYFRTNWYWVNLFPQLASGEWHGTVVTAFRDDAHPDATCDWLVAHATFGALAEVTGFPTGFGPLDGLSGGFRGLALLAGPTSSGKTTLVLQGLLNALTADPGLAALVVTTEMSKTDWLRKFWCCASGVPFTQAFVPNPDPAIRGRLARGDEAVLAVMSRLKLMTSLFEADSPDEDGARYLPTRGILTREANRFLRHTGAKRVLVVLDSLDYTPFYVTGGDGRERLVRSGPHDLEADVVKLRELRQVVQVFNRERPVLSIVAVTRVSSKGDRGSRLGLADVRGSSDLVFECDQVFMIQRDGDGDGGVTPTVVRVAKSRDVGSEGEVRLDHHYRVSRFVEPGSPTPAAAGGPGQPFAL